MASHKTDRHPIPEQVEYPLEQHLFEGHGNDFLCKRCNRPRALHADPEELPKPDITENHETNL